MVGRLLLSLVLVTSAGGCLTHRALAKQTVNLANTITDINHQQVLDNVALFTQNPYAIPSIAVVSAGTVGIDESSEASTSAQHSPSMAFRQQAGGLAILSLIPSFQTERELTENWSLHPVTDITHLRRIRCAFQLLVTAASINECADCEKELKDYFLGETQNLNCIVPRGWYSVGSKKDVPKNACYVGHHCGVYVWVMPDGLDGLSRFTLSVMDMATGEPYTPQREVYKSYKADGTLERYEIRKSEIDRKVLKDPEFLPDRERTGGNGARKDLDRGLFFVPR